MGMFTNYQCISGQPNNLKYAFPQSCKYTKLDPVSASKPFEEYNAKGELIGYYWRQGETVNLEFNIDGEITVESDSIIVDAYGYGPSEHTPGFVGQRLYNIADLRSWTCASIIESRYIWNQDEVFTYPQDSERSVYMSASDYIKDKTIEISLYDFRREKIYSQTFAGSTRVILTIDRELSERLTKGIYYCSVKVFNNSMCQVIFDAQDCSLLVK